MLYIVQIIIKVCNAFCRWNTFSYERFRTKTCFDTEERQLENDLYSQKEVQFIRICVLVSHLIAKTFVR